MSEWLTVKQAIEHLQVSRQTLYRWCDEGRLPFYELESGGGRRFRRDDLDRLVRPGASAIESQALATAAALGHDMEPFTGDLKTPSRYSRCRRCRLELTIGPQTGAGGPIAAFGPVLTTTCSAAGGG